VPRANHIRTSAVLLRQVAYGESDRVVTLLTRDHGKVPAFARGARKSVKRFRGGLGFFALTSVALNLNASGLSTLRESDTEERWDGIASDLHKMSSGSYLLELFDLALADAQGDPSLFDRVVRLLRWLNDESRGVPYIEAGVHRMQLMILDELGVLPDLELSARTGRPLHVDHDGPIDDAPGVYWIPNVGIIHTDERYAGEAAIALRPSTLHYLRGCAAGKFPAGSASPERLEARNGLARCWRHLLERESKAVDFYHATFR